MLLIHPKTGAKFKGDANSDNFGRGDRAKVVLLDEFASFLKQINSVGRHLHQQQNVV